MADVISMWPAIDPSSALGLLLARMPDLVRQGPAEWGGPCPCSHETDGEVYGVLTISAGLPEWYCARECGTGTLHAALWPETVQAAQTVAPLNRLASMALRLTPASLLATPPARRYLLHDTNTGAGVFVAGKVGLIAAAGGSGKSWALTQLAVAVATGTTWFGPGGWAPAAPGRVLALFAEEDREEVTRRLHYAARAAGLTSEADLALLARNVTALGLSGHPVGLTTAEGTQTQFAAEIVELLQQAVAEGRPYALVIGDPLSRLSGGTEAETKNDAATQWVTTVERFTLPDCGTPAVMIAHHVRKPGKDEPASASESAGSIRGSSALVDGVRWAARLEQQRRTEDSPDLLTLRIVKANGIPPQLGPLVLCRDSEHEGALRLATPDEQEAHETVKTIVKKRLQAIGEYEARVVASMRPDVDYTRSEVAKMCGGKKAGVLAAVAELVRSGRIVATGSGAGSSIRLREPGTDAGTDRAMAADPIGSRFPHHPKGVGTREPVAARGRKTGSEETGTGSREPVIGNQSKRRDWNEPDDGEAGR